MNLAIAACLVLGLPHGVCRAEIEFWSDFASPAIDQRAPIPAWVSPAWVESAARIVSGEAANCDGARLITACTIYNDITVRGWQPWTLVTTRGRWKGRNIPHQADYDAVEAAISGACENQPVCLYLGNWQDYRGWIRSGLIDGNQPALVWSDRHSDSVCIPMSGLDYMEVRDDDEFNE